MRQFSRVRERYAGHPLRGFPHPSGGSPSPITAPQRGANWPPTGRGRAAPLSGLRPPRRPPRGTPAGFPRLVGRLPLPLRFGRKEGATVSHAPACLWQAKRAGAKAPEWGLKNFKASVRVRGRQAARRWKCGEGRAAGGQGWGQPVGNPAGLSTGCPCLCPRAAKRRPVAQRSPHLHGQGGLSGPLWGPVAGKRSAQGRQARRKGAGAAPQVVIPF